METIGQRITELRKHKSKQIGRRFTQADLAKKMNVEEKQISKWETDEVRLSADKIIRLADFFNVSTDYLLRGGNIENLVMMNETGLSDQTIDHLRELRSKGKTESSEMINLLCDTRFSPHKLLPAAGELLLSAMYRFIHCDDLPVYEPSEQGGKYIGSHADLDLLRIISELQDLRESCQRSKEQQISPDDQGREVYILDKTHTF